RPGAADTFDEIRVIAHAVGDHIPMTGRRFGVRTISPEFGQHTHEVAALNDIGRIRQTGDRIIGVAGSVVGAEGVVPGGSGRNVNQDAVVGRQFAAVADHLGYVTAELGISHAVEIRRWTWINPRPGRVYPC